MSPEEKEFRRRIVEAAATLAGLASGGEVRAMFSRGVEDWPRNELGDCVHCGQPEGRQHDDVQHGSR